MLKDISSFTTFFVEEIVHVQSIITATTFPRIFLDSRNTGHYPSGEGDQTVQYGSWSIEIGQ